MTLDERIIDFLDGSLPTDDEAELLHSLSVSPEKRGVLHGFMDQRALITRDAKSLSVPISAEERMWARMNEVLPIEAAIVPEAAAPNLAILPVATRSAGLIAHALNGASATIGAITLLAGLGIGYFAGHSLQNSIAPTISAIQTDRLNQSDITNHFNQPLKELPSRPLAHSLFDVPLVVENIPAASTQQAPSEPAITPIAAILPPVALHDIGGDGGLHPILHEGHGSREVSSSFLSRFEFRIDEGFGQQFPGNADTKTSMPIITNTSISTFFQVLPHSDLLWAGASYGAANLTRKELFAQPGDPTDPLQMALSADTVHVSTSYIAALAELRLPIFETAEMTLTGGYGLATLGQLMFGELGLHYDLSTTAGIQCGVRLVRFNYDLTADKQSIINSGTSSFAISNQAASTAPSFNTELNAGLFFHF